MMKKTFLLILGWMFICVHLTAQESTTIIDAEFRPRFILDNGYKKPKLKETDPVGYITQRTRLNLWHESEKLNVGISVQDVRYWGGEDNYAARGSYSDTRSVDFHQAWFAFKPLQTIEIKAGRQIFSYGDQRILSVAGWNDYQVSYDAVLLRLNTNNNFVDMAVSWNADNKTDNNYPQIKYKTFDFVRYEKKLESVEMSILSILTGNTVSDTTSQVYYRTTSGINLKYFTESFNVKGSFYYQNRFGGVGAKARSYLFSVNAQHSFFNHHLSIEAGLDYISGQDETNNDPEYQSVNHTFDILYGRKHGYYGYMDYFSSYPEQGLQDYMFKLNSQINKNIKLSAHYHHFLLAADRIDQQNTLEKLNRNLGDEFDFVLKWKIIKEINLEAGYCFYLTSDTLEQIKAVDGGDIRFPQLAYMMITVKPQLLVFKNSK